MNIFRKKSKKIDTDIEISIDGGSHALRDSTYHIASQQTKEIEKKTNLKEKAEAYFQYTALTLAQIKEQQKNIEISSNNAKQHHQKNLSQHEETLQLILNSFRSTFVSSPERDRRKIYKSLTKITTKNNEELDASKKLNNSMEGIDKRNALKRAISSKLETKHTKRAKAQSANPYIIVEISNAIKDRSLLNSSYTSVLDDAPALFNSINPKTHKSLFSEAIDRAENSPLSGRADAKEILEFFVENIDKTKHAASDIKRANAVLTNKLNIAGFYDSKKSVNESSKALIRSDRRYAKREVAEAHVEKIKNKLPDSAEVKIRKMKEKTNDGEMKRSGMWSITIVAEKNKANGKDIARI